MQIYDTSRGGTTPKNPAAASLYVGRPERAPPLKIPLWRMAHWNLTIEIDRGGHIWEFIVSSFDWSRTHICICCCRASRWGTTQKRKLCQCVRNKVEFLQNDLLRCAKLDPNSIKTVGQMGVLLPSSLISAVDGRSSSFFLNICCCVPMSVLLHWIKKGALSI